MNYVIAAGFTALAVWVGTLGPFALLIPFFLLLAAMFALSKKDAQGIYRDAPAWTTVPIPAALGLFLASGGIWGIVLSIPCFLMSWTALRKEMGKID